MLKIKENWKKLSSLFFKLFFLNWCKIIEILFFVGSAKKGFKDSL